MAKNKAKQNISGIIITAIAALLAIASVVFLIITISGSDEPEDADNEPALTTGFVPDAELISATEQAAYELLQDNYNIYRYLTKGMNVLEEPYGNLPEDGFYTCDTDDFADFDKFSEYVHSVFVDETAEKLLTDPFGNGPVYGYDQGGLGLSMNFVPSDEELSWDVSFTCTPLSEIECDLEVTIKDADGNSEKKELKLVLEGGSWKLSEMIS